MPAVRVMFIGQGPSGLAEDRVVNTFHFADFPHSAVSCSVLDINNCIDLVQAFYTDSRSPAGPLAQENALASYHSPWVGGATEFRGYDLYEPGVGPGTGAPRTPVIRPVDMSAWTSTAGLPEEVAVCLSYNGGPPNTPRRRGRIYFGPIGSTGCTFATTGSASHPSAPLVSDLTLAARNLADQFAETMRWCVRSSKPTQNFVPILYGYVDNAFDTQIRRGPIATGRTTWSNTVGLP